MGEKKKRNVAAKTLETAREAGYFAKKMLSSAQCAVAQDKPVAWVMFDWWLGSPVAKAMGVELIYPENYGAFCAASGRVEPYLEYAAMDGYPATLCGYARNCFGYTRRLRENNYVPLEDAPGGGMPRPRFLLGCSAHCDAHFKWFQSLGRYMDVPVWTLELPLTAPREYFIPGNKEDNIRFMTGELRAFVTFLEKMLGKKMDWDLLEEKIDTMFKTHRVAYEVDLLRKNAPCPVFCTDFWAIMIPVMYMPDEQESLDFYQRVYAEVKAKVDNHVGAIPNEKYRLLFAEIPPWHTLGIFNEFAEKHGTAFVMESWSYHAPPPLPEEERAGIRDPLELLARYTYHKYHEGAAFAYEQGMEPTYMTSYFLQYAMEYKADGLFCHFLQSCRPATYMMLHLRNQLLQKMKVPTLVVEGDIVDLRVFNVEETHAKMDAFIETMDYHRELRKKEGFDW